MKSESKRVQPVGKSRTLRDCTGAGREQINQPSDPQCGRVRMSQHITNAAGIPDFHSLSQPQRSQGIKEAHNSWSGISAVPKRRGDGNGAGPASSRCKAMMGGLGFPSNRGISDRSLTSNGSQRGNEGRKMGRNRWVHWVLALGPKPNFRKLKSISWSGKDRSPSPLLFFFFFLNFF